MAGGLVVTGLSHSLPLFLAAWVIIGVGMETGLYDALFATLGTRYGAQRHYQHHAYSLFCKKGRFSPH